MPTISASPSPVGVYSRNPPKATTYVSWNTESAAVGTASVSENGGQPQTLGSGQAGGPVPLEVTLGSTYRLSLTVPSGIGGGGAPVEIANALVETFDLRQQMAAGFSQAFVPQLGMPKVLPQMITGLVVRPGVDTVQIAFRTTLPTIPTTELRDDAGNWVDGKLPLFGGLRTRHEVEFGFEEALALNTKHSFKIEAFGPTGDPASPNKAIVTGEFITGTRNVDVVWEMLDLHDDSDSTGAGELSFAFAVGDVGTGAALGNPSFLNRDMSDADPPIDLGITQALTDVHRELWLQVLAHEDDKDFLPFSGISSRGMIPSFEGPGGRYEDDGDAERVELTIVANVDTDPGLTTISFELRTGDWPLDFVVTGHLDVDAIVGSVIAPKMTKSKLPPKRDALLTKPGDVFGLVGDGASGTADVVALGADGALYHRRRDRQGAGRGGLDEWNRIELPGLGKPVAVASGPESIDLVDLDARGGVHHCEFEPAKPKRPKWRKLGGYFRQVVPIADPAKRKGDRPGVALFGIDEAGALHVHDARSDGREWTQLGAVSVDVVAPVSGNAAVLLAVAGDGSLLHVAKSKGRWRSEPIARKAPGEGPTQLLTAAIVERVDRKDPKRRHRDLVIGALDSAHRVQMLNWPDYPDGSPETRWKELGPLQDLMLSDPETPRRERKSGKG